MLFDAVPFSDMPETAPRRSLLHDSVKAFVNMLEKKLDVSVLYDAQKIPFGRADLLEPFTLAYTLQEHGIIRFFGPQKLPPDEPPIKIWGTVYGEDAERFSAGGASTDSDEAALFATLAEALERYIWINELDYFVSPIRARVQEMLSRAPYIAPDRFAGFSEKQRRSDPRLALDPDASYLWTRGISLVTGRSVYLPAQTVSGNPSVRMHEGTREPLIRLSHTIGLATWPEKRVAQLAGAMEVIEREAYMVTWLNKLTRPRVSLDPLRHKSRTLSHLLDTCERYRLKVHAVQLLSDAPAHSICVVIEDMSGSTPRFAFGLKTHRSLSYAIEKAATEALRSRTASRRFTASGQTWDLSTPLENIGHRDRLFYWMREENAKKLEFFVAGKEEVVEQAPWENDTPEEHLARVIAWCRENDFECVSVSLGTSKKNPTPWHIEMVVMPDLQPTYLFETPRQLGDKRVRTIPEKFGIAPRDELFLEPHPFS